MRAVATCVLLALTLAGLLAMAVGRQPAPDKLDITPVVAAPLSPSAMPAVVAQASRPRTQVGVVIVRPDRPAADDTDLDLHRPGINEEAGNRLLGALVNDRRPGLARELEVIARDTRHTPRWRNYAVQHLGDLHARDGDAISRAALQWATTAEEPLVREAGVFGLARTAVIHGDTTGEIRTVIGHALESDTSDLVREAAIRGLALLGWRERNRDLLALIGNTTGAPALRVAAADALGVLGGADELSVLERLRSELQPRRDGDVLIAALNRACARLTSGGVKHAF